MAKKILIGLVSLLLVVGLGLGIFFGVRACNDKKKAGKNNVTYEVMYLNDEVKKGDQQIFRIIVKADVKFTAIKYKLDNGEEQTTTVKTGESKDLKDNIKGSGKYYIDTGTEIIETGSLAEGTHLLKFFASDEEGTTYTINAEVIMFEVTAAA